MKNTSKFSFRAVLRWFKVFFTNNIILKLVSVAIALVFWTYIVDNTPSLTRTKFVEGLSVSVTGSSTLSTQGLALATDVYTDFTGKINAEVEVSQNQFSKVNSANVGIVLDVSSVRSAGTHELTLSAISVYGEVTHIYPETITVQIDNLDSRDVPIEAVLTGNQRDDLWYSVNTDSLNPQQITISGPASLVQQAAGVVANVDVTNQTSSFRRAALLTMQDANGQALNTRLLSRSSSTCSVSVDVYPTKELPVYVDASEINVEDGYVIENISFNPSTVTVAGEQALIDGLERIPIELPDNMPDINKTFTKRLPLSRLAELKYVSSRQAHMTVSVKEEEDSTAIDDIPVHIISTPDGCTVEIEPNAFNVQITGPRSRIMAVTPNDIYAYVDLTGLSEGIYDLPIVIGNNPDLSYASLSPSVVRVMITASKLAPGMNTEE